MTTERDHLRAQLHAAWCMMDRHRPRGSADAMLLFGWEQWLKDVRNYYIDTVPWQAVFELYAKGFAW